MDESHKKIVEQIFNSVSFTLSEKGKVPIMFFLIVNKTNQEKPELLPIVSVESISTLEYAKIAINTADEMNADAMIMIAEQAVVSKKKDDPSMNAILSGKIRPSEHPDKKDYITVIYMTSKGESHALISEIHEDLKGTRYTIDHKWINSSVNNLMVPWR